MIQLSLFQKAVRSTYSSKPDELIQTEKEIKINFDRTRTNIDETLLLKTGLGSAENLNEVSISDEEKGVKRSRNRHMMTSFGSKGFDSPDESQDHPEAVKYESRLAIAPQIGIKTHNMPVPFKSPVSEFFQTKLSPAFMQMTHTEMKNSFDATFQKELTDDLASLIQDLVKEQQWTSNYKMQASKTPRKSIEPKSPKKDSGLKPNIDKLIQVKKIEAPKLIIYAPTASKHGVTNSSLK